MKKNFKGDPFSYYSVLGLSRTDDFGEIGRAYRRLAKKFHPDKCDGDSSRFIEIQTAYETLSDKAKKSAYDVFCQKEEAVRAEREYKRAQAEKRSAIFGFKNPQKLRKTFFENLSKAIKVKFEDLISESVLKKMSKDVVDAVSSLTQKFENSPFEVLRQRLRAAERNVDFLKSKDFAATLSEFKKNV